jgi:DNA invertase Pin-like site-specific DNA recombinase
MKNCSTRCGVYCRSASATGLDGQSRACRQFLGHRDHHGRHPLISDYSDLGGSGNRRDRLALRRLLGDARRGILDAVVVESIVRLGRKHAWVLEVILGLASCGVSFFVVAEGIHLPAKR